MRKMMRRGRAAVNETRGISYDENGTALKSETEKKPGS